MKGLEEELLERLAGKRFGVVGIGNVIKGDDGAGCLVVEKLGEDFAMPTVDCAEVPGLESDERNGSLLEG